MTELRGTVSDPSMNTLKKGEHMDDLRSHGLNQNCVPTGVPKAKLATRKRTAIAADVECPNCGCLQIMEVEVPVKNKQLSGGSGVGYYLGCPACAWASPMIAIAMSQGGSTEATEA